MTERIKNDTANYLQNNDPVQQFIDDKLEKTDKEKILYNHQSFINNLFNTCDNIVAWLKASNNDNKGLSTLMFKNILTSLGFTPIGLLR